MLLCTTSGIPRRSVKFINDAKPLAGGGVKTSAYSASNP